MISYAFQSARSIFAMVSGRMFVVRTKTPVLAMMLTVALSSIADAFPMTVPIDLAPGEQYRLVFVTSTTRDAVVGSIAPCNAFVSGVAAHVPELAALTTSWTAIASTGAVNARDNTGTNPNVNIGVPVYTLDGQRIADNYAQLWSGQLMRPINLDEYGNTRSNALVWTGSWSNGTKADKCIVASDDPWAGTTACNDYRWTAVDTPSWGHSLSFYGMSGVLTAPAHLDGMIAQVPAYNWYHGCTPTTAASIMGYYDLHGYPNLFTASGWDAVRLTANVQDQISSPAHNAKYDPTPDRTDVPAPAFTSIADWLRTSVDPMVYGATSYGNNVPAELAGYAAYRGYQCSAHNVYYGSSLTWDTLKAEIDASRPVMFVVDSDGDGIADHSVPVLAYDDRGAGGEFYGCYTTWSEDETVAWYQFQGLGAGAPFGVWGGTFVQMTPEPATLSLLALGGLAVLHRKRK